MTQLLGKTTPFPKNSDSNSDFEPKQPIKRSKKSTKVSIAKAIEVKKVKNKTSPIINVDSASSIDSLYVTEAKTPPEKPSQPKSSPETPSSDGLWESEDETGVFRSIRRKGKVCNC